MKKLILYILLFLSAFQFVEAQRPTPFRYGIVLGSFANDPTGYTEGQIYWNTTTKRFRQYNGTIWEDLLGVVQNIEDLATTQIVDIGNIGSDAIEDGFNAFTFSEDIQEQSEGYVIINTIQNGEAEQYLFVGEGGDYGVGGTLTAVADDFVLLNEETDLGLYVPYDGATRDVNLGLNNLTLGQNLFLSETGNGLSSQGLGFQVSPNNNGRYIIRLNANNESSPGLNFLPESNYRTSFKDVNGLEILRINTNSLLAPFADASNSTNAKSVIVREVMESYVASQIGDNVITKTLINASSVTLLAADVENSNIFVIDPSQTNVTITIPPTVNPGGMLFLNIYHEGTGDITVQAGSGVTFTTRTFTDAKRVVLYSDTDDIWKVKEENNQSGNSESESNIVYPLPDNAVRLLAITGQSNASGRGDNADATAAELLDQPNAQIFVAGIVDDFQDLDITTTNNGTDTDKHGVELGVARKFLQEFPNDTIYIAKYAVGGTDIDANSPGGAVYTTFNDDYLEPAIDSLLARGKIPYVHFFYGQGEADANAVDYSAYAEKLQLLKRHYERKLGKNVHFIFPEILELGANTNESDINDIFNANHVLYDNVTTVQSKAYPAQDLQHWDYDGYKLIAEEIYRAMVYKQGALVFNSIDGYTADLTDYKEGIINYSNATIEEFPESALPSQVSGAEITAATETTLRSYSPANIKSFIDTHGGGGGGVANIPAAQFGKEYAWLPYGGGLGVVGTNNPTLVGSGANVLGNFSAFEIFGRWNTRQQTGAECGAYEPSPSVTSVGSGFYFQAQFKIATVSGSDNIQFYGLANTGSAIGNVDPSTLTNVFGIAVDDTDTNFHFIHNDNTGTATKVDLGSDFARGTLTIQLELYNPIGTTDVQYRVINMEDDVDTGWQTITTDLPSITNGLNPHLYMNEGAGSGTNVLSINYLKINSYQ